MRICSNCNLNKTYTDKKGHQHWYSHNNKWYCEKCDDKLFKNPKWHPITDKKWNPITNKKWNPINNPKHLWFKGKTIVLKQNPRTGQCSLCGKMRRTNIHHIQYHEDDPLKDTIELCVPCHRRKHRHH